MLDLNPGDRFAGCQIISMCGRGGYGTVYLAEDGVGRRVALKLVSTVDKRRELEGIRAYMKLASTSKHLLPIRHVGIERDELFYIMEPADPVPGLSFYLGDTLGKRLRQQGRLDPSSAIDIIRKTASAVRELHRAGFIHRDIKPGNIIFLHGEPVLSDPGLCCSAEQSVSLAGTLGFLPPECFFGEDVNSRQSDIFALGKCLYCAITGEAPGRFPRIPAIWMRPSAARYCRSFSRPAMRKKRSAVPMWMNFCAACRPVCRPRAGGQNSRRPSGSGD